MTDAKRFCSRKCFYAVTNAAKVKARWSGHVKHGQFDGRHCIGCNAPIIRKEGQPSCKWRAQKFCSAACLKKTWHIRKIDEKRSIDTNGYVKIRIAQCCDIHRGKTTFEHVIKAEHAIGRKLDRGEEVVHHVNGNKGDNRSENLLVCNNSYHKWLHARMGQLYQRERFA